MEVEGIDRSNPDGLGGNNSKGGDGTTDSLRGLEGVISYLERIEKNQEDVISSIDVGFAEEYQYIEKNTGALHTNTEALLNLSDSLSNMSVDINVNGFNAEFFSKIASLDGDNKQIVGMERFADIYSNVVKRIANLETYADQIDRVTGSMMGAFGSVKELGKGMLVFAGGLALLGFTIATFMEAITFEDMLTFGAIMLMIRGASEIVSKGAWDLAKVSVGIATLGLAVWGFTEVIGAEKGQDFLESIAYISAGLGIMNLISRKMGKNMDVIVKGAFSIAAIAGSIWLLNKAVADFDEVDLIKAGEMALITAGFGVVYFGLGKFMSSILQGAVSAAAIGGSLWLLSEGVKSMSEIDMSLERGLELAAITVAAAGILTLIGNPVTIGFTLAGAGATALIGVALLALSSGMQALTKVSVSEEQAESFGNSIVNVVDALSYLGNPLRIAPLVVAVPAALAVTAATLSLSGAVWAVSKMPKITDEKRDSFSDTLNNLVEVYSGLGFWGLAKATAASAVVTVMSGATMLSAGAIWAFTKISASPGAVDNAVTSLDNFITGVSTAFQNNKSNFSSIGDGVESFMGLSSMTSEIADTVQRIANMEFLKKEIRNGKVVVTGVRSFKPTDFARVGESIGKILNALTDPLAKIASEKDSFSIGGFEVTNPFSNKVQSGIEAMMGIGKVFTPLADIVGVFYENNIGDAEIKSFNTNIASLLGGVGTAFSQDGLEIDEDVLESMSEASNALKGIIESISTESFAEGNINFQGFTKNLTTAKNSLNDINLERLNTFNDLIYNMNEMEKSGAIDRFVEAFEEFLDKLAEVQVGGGESQIIETRTEVTNNNTERSVPTNSGISRNDIEQVMMDSNGDVVSAIEKLINLLSSGNVKVKLKEGLV